jgi:hypothetical protein
VTTHRDALLAALLLLLPALALGEDGGTPPVAPVTPPVAATDATVSLLEPGAEGCEWVQLEPLTAARRVLARLAVDCQGGGTALSRDGKRGAARFWRGGISAPTVGKPTFPESLPLPAFRDRLFLVEFATGSAEELPLPPLGELVEYGFDAGGRLLGLTLQGVTPAQVRAGVAVVEGAELRLDVWGKARPLLAHAFAWREGKWTRLDSRASTDVSGTHVLALRKALGERSSHTLDPRFTPGEVEDDGVLEQLYALSPELPEGEWTQVRLGRHTLAVWSTSFSELMLATGLVRRVERRRVLALPGYPYRENDLVSLQGRGPFLLVALADSGAHPRLYRGGKLVWSAEGARAVTFWPK